MKSLDKLLGLKEDILLKISQSNSIDELNQLRREVADYMTSCNNKENFEEVRKSFVRRKNKLKRD